MPRICKVCAHPQAEEINKLLIETKNILELSKKYNLPWHSLKAHKQNHLPAVLSKAKEAQEITQANDVMAELKRCFERVNLLFDACDRWLRDADNPSQYDIGPRADDVIVTYYEPGKKKGKPKKASVSQILARIKNAGYQVESWETKHSDPRELILKTANRLQGQIELLAKLQGELQQQQEINVQVVVPSLLEVLQQEVKDTAVLERIANRISQLH